MARLTALPGGGEPARACGVCGAHYGPCGILRSHLDWLRLLGRSPNSIYARERAIIRMGAWLADPGHYEELGITGSAVPVLDASAANLAAWRASLDLSYGAVCSYVSHAKHFCQWLVAEGLRADNPAAGLPVLRQPRRLPRPVSEESLFRVLESAPPRIRLWLVLAGWCGLRAAEIAGLTREAILDTRTPPVLVVSAESAKGSRERVIPLSPFVLAEIAAANLPAAGYAFRRRDGHPGPNAPWLVSHRSNMHLHECGVPATLHSLRHRALSQMYQHGRDLRAVQSVAGHASPATTSGYAAFSDQSAVDALNAIPAPGRLHVVAAAKSRRRDIR